LAKLLRLVIVLTAITTVSGLTLSYVHKMTAGPIKMVKIRQVKAPAVAEVFAGLKPENDPTADLKEIQVGADARGKPVIVYAFPAKKGGQTVAVAIETFGVGYHEGLGVMTAIGAAGEHKGKVIKIGITSHHETPGKGDKVTLPDFKKQFAGLEATAPVDKSKIDAISGATMSTNGVIEAVNKALEIFKAHREQLLN